MPIPKIIHHIWNDKDIPYHIYKKEWVDSWKLHHPDWEYRLWTNQDCQNLIKEHYPQHLELYNSYDTLIKRVDVVRYFILHKHGGLYVDLDFECLKNIDELLQDHDLVLGRMGKNVLFPYSVPNALMASAPQNPFWLDIIRELPYRQWISHVETSTGMILLYSVLVSYEIKIWFQKLLGMEKEPLKIKIYPHTHFYPLHCMDNFLYKLQIKKIKSDLSNIKNSYPQAYAITYWTHNW